MANARFDFPVVDTNVGSVADPINPNDAANRRWVLANAGSLSWDTAGAQVTTLSTAITAGATSAQASGDFTTQIPNNSRVIFANNPNGNIVYLFTNPVFAGGTTTWTISPAAGAVINLGTGISLAVKTPITDLIAGNNVSGSVNNATLTLNASGGGSGSIYWDVYGSTMLGVIGKVAPATSTVLELSGNVTAAFPANQLFYVVGDITIYTAVSATFNGVTNRTVLTITPGLNIAATLGLNVFSATRTAITDITGGNYISGTIANSQLTLNAFTGAVDPTFVFRSSGNYTAAASINIGSSAEPVAANSCVITLAQINGTLAGVPNPGPIGIAVANGTTLSQVLASATFLNSFFTTPLVWTASFTAPATVTFTYSGTNSPITSGTPSLELNFVGTWTNPPVTTASALVSASTVPQVPTFGTLRSSQITPAIAGTPGTNQVVGWDAPNARLAWQNQTGGIASINTQTGPAVNVVAGTGIGISSAGNNITVTNTGSGSIASGNFTSFNAVVQRSGQNTQMFAPTAFIASSALDQAGIYVDICGGGWLNETNTLLDGGAIGNTTYITTTTRTGTNGLVFPVSTTYGEVECQLFTQNLTLNVTYNSAGGTLGSVRVEAYFALRGLNASSSQAPYQSSAVFPPFSFPSDGVTFLYVFQPVYTFVNTGTGSATLTIPAAQFRAISPQYTGLGGTNEYIPYLRVLLFNTAANPAPLLPTSASVASYSALPSMRVLMTLPGVGGATPTIQQVLNTGNTATNTTGNVSTIILNDSVSGSATTLDGTQLRSRLHQFDGSTSGNVQIRAAATTTSYALTLPPAQGGANQTLVNNGSGVLSWGSGGGATNVLPLDNLVWTNSGQTFASSKTAPLQNVSGTIDATLSFVTLASAITGAVDGTPMIGATASGQSLSGFYMVIASIPSVQTLNIDRSSNLVAGTYSFQWRLGRAASSGLYMDQTGAVGSAVLVTELGWSGNGISLTADSVNAGRYVFNITPTLSNILSNGNLTSGRNLILSQTGGVADQLRFHDNQQPTPNFIALRAPASALASNVTLTLPNALPASTLPLVSDSTGVMSFATSLALTSGSVANAPVNPTDIARLTEVQAATLGLKPQGPPNTNVHIAEVLVVGTYARNGGIGLDTLTTNTQLVVANLTPAVNDWVVLVNQTPFVSLGYQNGSYVVTSTSAGGTVLTRTSVVPSFGNFYTANVQFSTNYGSGYENVTTGTITIGTTNIQFAKLIYGQPGSAINFHQPVRAATVPGSPINTIPSTLMPIDGYTPSLGDRILIKDLSSPLTSAAAGIYIVTNGSIWPRADDWNQSSFLSITAGAVIVSGGSTNATTVWIQTQPVTTVGTSAQAFQLFSAAGGSGTLQSVLTSGKSATATASTGLTLFSDLTAPLTFTNVSGIAQLSWANATVPVNLTTNASGDLILNPSRRLSVYTATGSTLNLLNITESNISRNGTGDLVIAGGTGATDGVIHGQGANNIRLGSTAAAGTPTISTVGTDTNISLAIVPTGTGKVIIGNSTLSQLNIDGSAAASLKLQAFGSGTNIITQISGKGSSPATSAVQLATSFPNYWSFYGATTPGTGNPTIGVQPAGLSTTTNIQIAGLGNGNVLLGGLGTTCGINILGNSSTQSVVQSQSATSTNCDIVLAPLGSGVTYIGDITGNALLRVSSGQTNLVQIGVSGGNSTADLQLAPRTGGFILLPSGISFNSGTTQAPAYGSPLYAANMSSSAPTAMTAGVQGDYLVSRGSASPAWVSSYTSGYQTLASTAVTSATNFPVPLTLGTLPDGITYSSGVITNNSGRPRLFNFSVKFQVSTGATSPGEVDYWLGNIGTRFVQITKSAVPASATLCDQGTAYNASAPATSNPWFNLSISEYIPNSGTFGFYAFGGNASHNIGGIPAGGFGTTSSYILTISP